MRAVILNGARQGEGLIDRMQGLMEQELERAGWQWRAFCLRTVAINACAGCFQCWVKTPGECVMRDENRAVTAATIGADLMILLTPVVFGGYSSELKKAVDHQIPLVSPFFRRIDGEVHHQPRYARYPDLLAIGVQTSADPNAAAIFTRLVERHAVNLQARRHSGEIWLTETDAAILAGRFQQIIKRYAEVIA